MTGVSLAPTVECKSRVRDASALMNCHTAPDTEPSVLLLTPVVNVLMVKLSPALGCCDLVDTSDCGGSELNDGE